MAIDRDIATERSGREGPSLAGEFILQGYIVASYPFAAEDIALLVDAVEMAAGKSQSEQLRMN